MRNYSKVWLKVHRRLNYENTPMSESLDWMRSTRELNIKEANPVFFIPRDARMNGV